MAVRRFREDKWIADVFRDGQRFRKVFDTKRHALSWDGKIKTAALEGKLFDVKQDTFATFAEMMDWFLALPEVQRKRSYDKDVGRSKHLKVFLGELSPSKITPEKIQEYIHQRLTAKNRNPFEGPFGHSRRRVKNALLLRSAGRVPLRRTFFRHRPPPHDPR